MTTYTIILLISTCLLPAQAQAPPGTQPKTLTLQQAFSLLRTPAASAREFYGTHQRLAAVEVIRKHPEVSPGEITDFLAVVLSDRNILCREAVLELACERADDSAALRIVTLLRILGAEYFGVKPISKPAKYADTRIVDQITMEAFTRRYSAVLAGRMSDQRPLMELFYHWLMIQQRSQKSPRLAAKICTAVTKLSVPIELRREYVLKILENYNYWPQVTPEMAALVDADMLPRLRDVVRRSIGNPDGFPRAVALLLADRADLDSLPVVSQAEALLGGEGFLKGRRPEEIAESCSWRIRIQHPPETLLVWLSQGPSESEVGRISQLTRIWIMERALASGLDKDEIREAALKYADQYAKAGYPLNAELPVFKRRAIKLGILRLDDLPEVKSLPKTRDRCQEETSGGR
ncbi:MAG: hypothetical protein ABII12_04055 [Planctomycetota bacterium]